MLRAPSQLDYLFTELLLNYVINLKYSHVKYIISLIYSRNVDNFSS